MKWNKTNEGQQWITYYTPQPFYSNLDKWVCVYNFKSWTESVNFYKKNLIEFLMWSFFIK